MISRDKRHEDISFKEKKKRRIKSENKISRTSYYSAKKGKNIKKKKKREEKKTENPKICCGKKQIVVRTFINFLRLLHIYYFMEMITFTFFWLYFSCLLSYAFHPLVFLLPGTANIYFTCCDCF